MGKYNPTSENSDGGTAALRRPHRSQRAGEPFAPPVVPTVKFTLPCSCGLPLLPGEREKGCPRCVHGARW